LTRNSASDSGASRRWASDSSRCDVQKYVSLDSPRPPRAASRLLAQLGERVVTHTLPASGLTKKPSQQLDVTHRAGQK